jgi:hypothetical protein
MKFLQNKKYKILTTTLKYFFIITLLFTMSLPILVKTVNAEGVTIENKIKNPTNIDDLPSLIKTILYIVLVVGVPIVALAIIYTGFLFVKAQGNPEQITKAKKALVYTLIGAALLLGSWVIANAIGKTVGEVEKQTNQS